MSDGHVWLRAHAGGLLGDELIEQDLGRAMLNAIAVMNTKGGVGKSTLVLALAETLSVFRRKNVLVIDGDAQSSVSSMLMTVANLHKLQSQGLTMVDFLVATVLNNQQADWTRFVVRNVSDVDDARSVYLLPSDMQLTLFEREVSKENLHARMRSVIGGVLTDARRVFDIILVDCPPGLSVLTESWLREADFHISPTKADYVSICGLEVFRRFKALNPEMGFARNLGVIINMKDNHSAPDEDYHAWLRSDPENRCFTQAIPRLNSLQDAARFQTSERSYSAKYPGVIGQSIRALAGEVVERMAEEAAQTTAEPQHAQPPAA
jgi:chromosome partitioning protein